MQKKLHYYDIILRANNKMKSTWKIINREKGTNQHDMSISSLTIDEITISNQCIMANMFNNYLSSVADSIKLDKNKDKISNRINPIDYLYNFYSKPFTNLKWQYASTYEIEKMIKAIKSKNSYGYHEIPSHIIKVSAPFILSTLTHICNAALSSGVSWQAQACHSETHLQKR
jgi:hypothetical protein